MNICLKQAQSVLQLHRIISMIASGAGRDVVVIGLNHHHLCNIHSAVDQGIPDEQYLPVPKFLPEYVLLS